MNRALQQFKTNRTRVDELGTLAAAIRTRTTPAIDVSDIWRAQIVLIVSALDHFVHELVWLGMIESARGARKKTDAFLRFDLPLRSVEDAMANVPAETWLGEAIRERHSWQSFQDPDKLADAIRLVSDVKLWNFVGGELGLLQADTKTRLKLIVDRRNKIAHESDLDPTNPGFHWQIDAQMVCETVSFVDRLAEAVYKACI